MKLDKFSYKPITLKNVNKIPQYKQLPLQRRQEFEVVSQVLPFRTNAFVTENLINWNDPDDPILNLNFPRREMLSEEHYFDMDAAIQSQDKVAIKKNADNIRLQLNPHPAGQQKEEASGDTHKVKPQASQLIAGY